MNNLLTLNDYRYRFPALGEDTQTDILITGGGFRGLYNAMRFTAEGKTVLLAEKHFIACGNTSLLPGCIFAYGTEERYEEYKKLSDKLFGLAALVGERNITALPHIYFSDTDAAFGDIIEDTYLAPFDTELPAGAFIDKGCTAFSPVSLCKNASEYLHLNGTRIYENTKIISAYCGIAETSAGRKIKYNTLINACVPIKRSRYITVGIFSVGGFPALAFSDDLLCPMQGYGLGNGKIIAYTVTRTYAAALYCKRTFVPRLTELFGKKITGGKMYITKAYPDYFADAQKA